MIAITAAISMAKRLRIGQRLEHAAFLRFQGQHRQEAHRDHQQREEGGARDFFNAP